MIYKVVITSFVIRQLDKYISYILENFKSIQIATSLRDDARFTADKLKTIADCFAISTNPVLTPYGYRKIHFSKHKFVMIYRIHNESTVVIEAIYHTSQDIDNLFISQANLN